MVCLVAAQLRKQLTTPQVAGLGGVGVLVIGLMLLVLARAQPQWPGVELRAVLAPWALAVSVGVGAALAGEEYAGRQIDTTLLAIPRRPALLAAMTAVAVPVVLVVAAALTGVLTVVRADGPASVASLGALVAPFVWSGVAAFGVGLVLRSTVRAVGAVLVVLWVLPRVLAPWPRLTGLVPSGGLSAADRLVVHDQVVWAVWTGVLLTVAALLFLRRDA